MALEPLMNSLKRLRESDLGPESYSEWHLIIVIKKKEVEKRFEMIA